MRLMVWEHAIATLLTGTIVAVYAAFLNGTRPWLNVRGATAVVLALGIGASAAWAWRARSRKPQEFAGVASIIGSMALLAAVIGLIIGSTVALSILVVGIFALWLIATVWCASSVREELVSGSADDGDKVTNLQGKASGQGHEGEVPGGRRYRFAQVNVESGATSPAPDQTRGDRAAS